MLMQACIFGLLEDWTSRTISIPKAKVIKQPRLNFVVFNPLQNNNPIAVRRRKLMAKIDEQIQLATNKD